MYAEKREMDELVSRWEVGIKCKNDHNNTCFQITTKTMSEMMTMTRSTSTAAATVSSGWGPVQEEIQQSHMLNGSRINHVDAACLLKFLQWNLLYLLHKKYENHRVRRELSQKVMLRKQHRSGGDGVEMRSCCREMGVKLWSSFERTKWPSDSWSPKISCQKKSPFLMTHHQLCD